jgi:hypothetical protein
MPLPLPLLLSLTSLAPPSPVPSPPSPRWSSSMTSGRRRPRTASAPPLLSLPDGHDEDRRRIHGRAAPGDSSLCAWLQSSSLLASMGVEACMVAMEVTPPLGIHGAPCPRESRTLPTDGERPRAKIDAAPPPLFSSPSPFVGATPPLLHPPARLDPRRGSSSGGARDPAPTLPSSAEAAASRALVSASSRWTSRHNDELEVDLADHGDGELEVDITVDAKSLPSAKHTASRTSWLHTRRDHKTCQSIFPEN